jgi:hypothetical protein
MNIKYKYLNKRFTNKTGQSGFVLKYVNKNEVYFKFDLTGWIGCFQMSHIRQGFFKDRLSPSVYGVGFIGDGLYKTYENGKRTKVYAIWNAMIQRCYDEKFHEKHPTYKDCTVVNDWHNFQNFAQWYEENYPNDGKAYDLDKDFLVEANRTYSPETCTFLTPQQNIETSLAKHYSFISPDGEKVEFFNLNQFCRDNDLSAGQMCNVANGKRNHHKGWTKA